MLLNKANPQHRGMCVGRSDHDPLETVVWGN